MRKVCEVYQSKNFCSIVSSLEDSQTLEFNQYQKSDKAPFITNADHEFVIEKIDGCKNNPQNSFTTKVSENIPSDFSMFMISSFKELKISMMYTEEKIV